MVSIAVAISPSNHFPPQSAPSVQRLTTTQSTFKTPYTGSISSYCPSHNKFPSPTYRRCQDASTTKRRRSSDEESLQYLLSTSATSSISRKSSSAQHFNHTERRTRKREMAGNHEAFAFEQHTESERKKSYGIGGAGNIRRPSDVIYPARMNPDGSRRRSSVWSVMPGTSPDGKRNGLLGFLRRSSVQRDEDDFEPVGEKHE